MNTIKKTFLLLFISTSIFAQEDSNTVVAQNVTPKLSVLDSIKKTFVKHNDLSSIDNLWMKELSNQELSDLQFEDVKNLNPDQEVAYDLSTALFKERLKRLDDKSPFNIEYNPGLENIVKNLLKNRSKSYERLLGISQYYFPLFEDALAKYNIPIEVKYLAIVESALNPKAKSRVGATGLWQFMYGTGLQYNLDVNSYIDERSDPIKATEAACKYLSGMYAIFGDWDLVLASYNCGPGNVTKAIRRSGGQKNYWNIRKNLPKETAGYLPMFLATMYIFEYHKEHGINAAKTPVNYFATDTIMVKKQLSFNQISKLIDIPVAELQFLNPSYKLDVVPYTLDKNNYLRLPMDKVAVFTSNEDKIYYYAQYEANQREKPYERPLFVRDSLNPNPEKRFVTRYKYHKVRRGDNLGEIASKYGVTTFEIKKWNKLRSNNAPLGRNLKILSTERILSKDIAEAKIDTTINNAKTQDKIAFVEKTLIKETVVYKEEKVVSYKDVTKTYKVKKGDNLSEIADKYNVSMAEIKKWNKLRSNNVPLGKSLKIVTNERVVTTIRKKEKKPITEKTEDIAETDIKPAKETKIKPVKEPETYKEEKVVSYKDVTKTYKVKKGDNLGEIADKYNVSTAEIKKWNKLKNNNVPLGKSLKIVSNEKVVTIVRKKVKNETANKQDEIATNDTKETKSKKADSTAKIPTTYIVASGDNLGLISKKFNLTIDQIKELNNLENTNVMVGRKLIVSISDVSDKPETTKKEDKYIAESRKQQQLYYVKKGDSLFSISQKYPGVTVSDLKKWNGIQDGNIKPGMKLKISG